MRQSRVPMTKKYTVYIDASVRYQNKLVLRDGDRVIDEKTGDFDMVGEIKKMVEKNGLKMDDIEEFVAYPGPGSFTGLKKGVTTANVLNWSQGKKKLEELALPHYGKEPNISKSS